MLIDANLRAGDFERLTHSGRIFARKFDATVDATVLDRLDEYLTSQAVASAG